MRREKTRGAGGSRLRAHAAFRPGTRPWEERVSKLRKAQKTKQLTAQQRPRVTELGTSVLLRAGPHLRPLQQPRKLQKRAAPFPAFGFPFNPRDRRQAVRERLQLLAWTQVSHSSSSCRATQRYCKALHHLPYLGGSRLSPPASGLTQKPHRAERFPANAKRPARPP